MNTKLIMATSAIVMGIIGMVLSFLPHEILGYFGLADRALMDALVIQVLGALYFAFAMVNWTAKGNLIGGIYGRPIAIGNLTHFVIGALALMKGYFSSHAPVVLVPAVVYLFFGLLFTWIFFSHPIKEKS